MDFFSLTLKYVYKIMNVQRHCKYPISILYYYFIQYTMQLCCNGQTGIFLYIGAFFPVWTSACPKLC